MAGRVLDTKKIKTDWDKMVGWIVDTSPNNYTKENYNSMHKL